MIAHAGNARNMHNQSPQMRHARNASRRLTANFDVGSFQWKKDAKWMNDNISGVLIIVEGEPFTRFIFKEDLVTDCGQV